MRGVLTLAMLLAMVDGAAGAAGAVSIGPTITVGYLAPKVEEAIDFMTPATRLVARALAPFGVRDVRLAVVPSIPEMTELLRNGKVDLFVSTPYPILKIKQMGGPAPVLYGVAAQPHRAVFFAHAGSGIRRVEDLDGKRLALTLPYSTPGYFLARAHLAARGIGIDRPGPSGRMVVTALTGGGLNSLYWVAFGRADACCVATDETEHLPVRLRQAVVEIDRTEEYPPFLVVFSPAMPAASRALLTQFISRMHETPEGLRVLKEIYGCERMAPIDPAMRREIERLDALIATVTADYLAPSPESLVWLRAGEIVRRPWASGYELLSALLGLPLADWLEGALSRAPDRAGQTEASPAGPPAAGAVSPAISPAAPPAVTPVATPASTPAAAPTASPSASPADQAH